MTIEQFNRLGDTGKLRAIAVALAQDQGGKLLVTSGMLARVPEGNTVIWVKDDDFDRIIWMVAS